MNILLRSTFRVNEESAELLQRNYALLLESTLDFNVPEDNIIWKELKEFVTQHNHIPEYSTLVNHFNQIKEQTVVDRLQQLSTIAPLFQGDFQSRLETRAEERRTRMVLDRLKECNLILQSGLTVKDGKSTKVLLGPGDAVRYFLDEASSIIAPTFGSKLSGEITSDGDDALAEYQRVKADPLSGIGQHCGIMQIDKAINGARREELWIHAGYTGHLKSTFALNWAYNQAVYFCHSSLYFSYEMAYSQCRRIFYAMHSFHPKFLFIRYWLGIQSEVEDARSLEYGKIRDGELSEVEEYFYENYVIPDFNGEYVDVDHHPHSGEAYFDADGNELKASVQKMANGEIRPYPGGTHMPYGKIFIERPDPDKDDLTVSDMRRRAELIYNKTPFSLLVVDHVGLMAPKHYNNSTTERQNEIIRDLKRVSSSFNRGQGIALLALVQINREGFKTAMKRLDKTGRAFYDLTSLAYSNEAEKSADVVTTTWIDEGLSQRNRVQFQNLKSRDQQAFQIFEARMEWSCRRMLTCFETIEPTSNIRVSRATENIDNLF